MTPIKLPMVMALFLASTPLSADSNSFINLQFDALAIPTSTTEKTAIKSTQKVTINDKEQTVHYHKLFATGEKNNGEQFGLIKDIAGKPILFEDGSPYICNGTNSGVGSGLDHISILQKNNKLYMVSQYECSIGAMYLNELEQDKQGQLSVKPNSLQFIDQSAEFGGYVHCAGQTTPWQSHLSSEEYEPNARLMEITTHAVSPVKERKHFDEVIKYWQGDASKISPYFYGWIPEIQIKQDGSPHYQKHYSMGRFSHELGYVMPDERTVYLSDDGTNVGLYVFVADTAQDLSAGTLYAAQWQQTDSHGLGAAHLNWISLGHATNQQVRDFIVNKPVFSDLFNTAQPNSAGLCPTHFTSINTTAGNECLQLKDINKDGKTDGSDEVIASRLETRRMAAYKGATTEFRKEEGITFNPQTNQLYIAMSEIALGMENHAKAGQTHSAYDIGGPNHIQLAFNPCGGVYALDIKPNRVMQSDYIAQNMVGLIAGQPKTYSAESGLAANQCDVHSLANPDNLSYLNNSNSLLIGEDSNLHENNFIWHYDLNQASLSRIFSTPLDAETTSPFWHKDINGWSYVSVVTQHPMKKQLVDSRRKESQGGYIGPFKLE